MKISKGKAKKLQKSPKRRISGHISLRFLLIYSILGTVIPLCALWAWFSTVSVENFCVFLPHYYHIQICRCHQHISSCCEFFQSAVRSFPKVKHILNDVKDILHLTTNTRFLIFHITEPTSPLALFPCILAVRFLFVSTKVYLG